MQIFSLLSQRARRLTVFAVLGVAATAPAIATAAEHQEVGALGRWKLTKALDAADIASLDDKEATQLSVVFLPSIKTMSDSANAIAAPLN